MGALRSVTPIVYNRTGITLEAKGANDYGLKHGIWTLGFPFTNYIAPGSQDNPSIGAWRTESDGAGTGSEGWANYKINGGNTVLRIAWESPALGSPKCFAWFDGPDAGKYKVDFLTSDEHNSTCKFDIRSA